MRPILVRVLAALSTLAVLAGGVWVNRDAYLETSFMQYPVASVPDLEFGPDGNPLPTVIAEPEPQHIRVDAGEGVRVNIEGRTGTAALTSQTRAWFAHAEVREESHGVFVARCQAPTPISRCAIWLSVTTASDRDTVHIVAHPGALVGDLPPAVNVTVEAR